MSLFAIERGPLKLLTIVFLAWKAVILLIALSAPGPGYDTSSTFLNLSPGSHSPLLSITPQSTPSFLTKLVRWDAIYYTSVAQRGHLFEQEWAFGVGLSTTLRWLATRLFFTPRPELYQIAVSGIVLSHTMHYLSTVLVYYIAVLVTNKPKSGPTPYSIPTLSALLYIISPAGVILSAPYSESLFAFRNLSGILIYILARRSFSHSTPLASILTILSGLILGTATAVRSNGILSGIPFLIDFLSTLHHASITSAATQRIPPPPMLARLSSLIIGGLLIATGQILPQTRAYNQYCLSPLSRHQPLRPWCTHTIPSIFTFVQNHYWNVGLFNYWKIGNLPLFLLAFPTITLLTYSSFRAINHFLSPSVPFPSQTQSPTTKTIPLEILSLDKSDSLLLALPQLILAIAAVFTYHIQIITRVASGYPWWYIWLAAYISHQQSDESMTQDGASGSRKEIALLGVKGEYVVKWMVLYGMIYTGLYASFLPPA